MQVLGFDEHCHLTPLRRLIRFLFVRPAFCLGLPSDSRSPATPLPLANTSPCRVCRGLSPPSHQRGHHSQAGCACAQRAMPGAREKRALDGPFVCTQTKITCSAKTLRCRIRISLSIPSGFYDCLFWFPRVHWCENCYKPSTDEACQGTYHRGIDDARNVASIVKEMLS